MAVLPEGIGKEKSTTEEEIKKLREYIEYMIERIEYNNSQINKRLTALEENQ